MKRILIVAFVAIMLEYSSASAEIQNDTILVIVGKTTTSMVNASGKYITATWGRWQKTLGLKYVVYDANYIKTCDGCGLYTHHGEAGSDSLDVWDIASQGNYKMAIALNLPVFSVLFDGSAATEFTSNGWGTSSSHFGQWINRNSEHAFPIPLFLPNVENIVSPNSYAYTTAVTGVINNTQRAWTSAHDRGLVDARGDSIYIAVQPSTLYESIVAGNDSASWCYPLIWRDDDASYDAVYCKPTYAWMTVGSGNHKVIHMPYAFYQHLAFMWPTIIGMFVHIPPIDMPIIAEVFGSADSVAWGTSQDTVSLGDNFKAIKDYAIENGMKIDLCGLTWSMKNETGDDAHPVFQTTAYEYANAHPNNIRITPSTLESWSGSSRYDWFGSVNSTTYNGVDGIVGRIDTTQGGIGANFPNISTSRVATWGGYYGYDYLHPDSVLMAMAATGITDAYANLQGTMYPISIRYMLNSPSRTWIGRGDSAKELRFYSHSSYWRYTLQNSNVDDTLRISYIGTAAYNDNRADVMRYLMPTMSGYYRTTGDGQTPGSQGISTVSTTNSYLATHGPGYAPGFILNALTFTGGSSAKSYSAAQVDSSRSAFLDMMKQINNQVRIANYIVDTYGNIKQPVFVYSWMEECKYDRRNNRRFQNDHVTK